MAGTFATVHQLSGPLRGQALSGTPPLGDVLLCTFSSSCVQLTPWKERQGILMGAPIFF